MKAALRPVLLTTYKLLGFRGRMLSMNNTFLETKSVCNYTLLGDH